MSKSIDTNRVAGLLRKFFCTKKSQISLALFQREMKNVLNAKEAERLFDYLIDNEHYLEATNKRFFKWTPIVKENSFSEDKVRDIFLYNQIQTLDHKERLIKYVKKEKESKPEGITFSLEAIENYEDSFIEQIIERGQIELNIRKQRREIATRRQSFAEKLGCTVEDLPKVVEEIISLF